jgi:hypothetical protein
LVLLRSVTEVVGVFVPFFVRFNRVVSTLQTVNGKFAHAFTIEGKLVAQELA